MSKETTDRLRNELTREDRTDRSKLCTRASDEDPYTNVPLARGMPLRCQHCSGQTFRRSTLRSADAWEIVLMRYPVRCLHCSQRQMVSFTVAGISLPSGIKPQKPASTPPHWTDLPRDSDSHSAPPSH
jgi:DNA-directed RNA polymerase subunit RPC12/RpoP